MVKVIAGVQAMPQRLSAAEELAVTLNARVYLLPDLPQARAARAVWKSLIDRALAEGGDWVLYVQDDALPCEDVLRKVHHRLASVSPDVEVVTFYSNSKEDAEVRAAGKKWRPILPSKFRNCQAIAMRVATANDVVAVWARLQPTIDPQDKWDDFGIARALHALKRPIVACIPNLFDHDLKVPSLLAHPAATGGVPRRSRTFTPQAE